MGRHLATTACVLAVLVLAGSAGAYSPPFPGAKRRSDPTGRWYATVERWSDRCALVERASGSPPVAEMHDAGEGRFGVPPPLDPIRPGDRVVVRERLGSYPVDLLPASDGSGFAAVTSDYGAPGFPAGPRVFLLSWVPARAPRLAFLLPEQGAPPKDAVWSTTVPWQIDAVLAEPGLVVLHGWPDRPATVVRVADGAVRSIPLASAADASAVARAFDSPPRKPFAAGTGADSRTRALAAIRGDPALALTPFERVPVVARAYELLGPDAGRVLLERLEGPERDVTNPERNVVRAAYWTLRSRPEGLALARAVLSDPMRPTEGRVLCGWILSESLAKEDLQPLVDATTDPDPMVAGHVASALADRRWEVAPLFLRFLEEGGRDERVIARYFEDHVVAGSERGLLRALRGTRAGSELREQYVKALETQTMRSDVGDDADAWERVLGSAPAK
jgi:hypothetical protein